MLIDQVTLRSTTNILAVYYFSFQPLWKFFLTSTTRKRRDTDQARPTITLLAVARNSRFGSVEEKAKHMMLS